MKQHIKTNKSPIPYYGVAILWLLIIVFQQADRTTVSMILSIIVFLVLKLITQPHEAIETAPLDSDQESVLVRGESASQALNRLWNQIQNREMREKISELENLSEKILNEVRERPEKQPKIRTFVDYYFPTTLNILEAYRRAEATGIEGENITKTKQQIISMLDSYILIVFNKQLDSLFGSDALDISMELSVLQNMMVREGITGDSSDDSNIKLTL